MRQLIKNILKKYLGIITLIIFIFSNSTAAKEVELEKIKIIKAIIPKYFFNIFIIISLISQIL